MALAIVGLAIFAGPLLITTTGTAVAHGGGSYGGGMMGGGWGLFGGTIGFWGLLWMGAAARDPALPEHCQVCADVLRECTESCRNTINT